MRAVLLVGHGSVRPGAGAAMIRLAARAQAAGIAPIVAAGFLNYSRPTFAEALARCVVRGAAEVVLMPYFLVPGKFVRVDLPRLLDAVQPAHPDIRLTAAQPFGDHPALAHLVLKRASAADGGAPADGRRANDTGLLIIAHGSPDPASNQPIGRIADHVRARDRYAAVTVCFMGLNQPCIPAAIDDLVARGVERLIAVPYFLQLGDHVAEDLPAVIAAARSRHPSATILQAGHLAYDRLLVSAIGDRVRDAIELSVVSRQR